MILELIDDEFEINSLQKVIPFISNSDLWTIYVYLIRIAGFVYDPGSASYPRLPLNTLTALSCITVIILQCSNPTEKLLQARI